MKETKGVTLIEILIVIAIIGILFVLIASAGGGCSTGDGERVGRVVKLSHKGLIWTTWEGDMLLGGQGAVNSGLYRFSITDPQIVEKVKKAMESQSEVRVLYHQNLLFRPWQGSTTYFITGVEPVRPTLESNVN